jgi:hypothetical protein
MSSNKYVGAILQTSSNLYEMGVWPLSNMEIVAQTDHPLLPEKKKKNITTAAPRLFTAEPPFFVG